MLAIENYISKLIAERVSIELYDYTYSLTRQYRVEASRIPDTHVDDMVILASECAKVREALHRLAVVISLYVMLTYSMKNITTKSRRLYLSVLILWLYCQVSRFPLATHDRREILMAQVRG